jgi:hypothetical protein
MENRVPVKIDSKAVVCYMNFGVGRQCMGESALSEEHRLCFLKS